MTTDNAPVTDSQLATPPTANKQASIHDAIDALFASKEAEVNRTESSPNSSTNPADISAQAPEKTELNNAPSSTPETAKSASEAVLEIARLKRQLAKAKQPNPSMPDAQLIEMAKKLQAAGEDPVKRFEASGLDLPAIVAGYEKAEQSADYPDPLAKEIADLKNQIGQLQAERRAAESTTIENNFRAATLDMCKQDNARHVMAMGDEGSELVKELVLQANARKQPILLRDAIRLAEDHFASLKKKLTLDETSITAPHTQTRKPAIPQQAPAAGTITAAKTKPRSVQDVISESIDALLG